MRPVDTSDLEAKLAPHMSQHRPAAPQIIVPPEFDVPGEWTYAPPRERKEAVLF
jgi:hypothetical protein